MASATISQIKVGNTTYDIHDANILFTVQSNMVGTVQMFAGSTAPTGWLICDGSAISRTTYAALFSVIGTTWGAGDGSTTFNLPDMRGRTPVGAGTGDGLTTRVLNEYFGAETHDHGAKTGSTKLTAAQSGLPEHTHGFTNPTVPSHNHTMNHGHGFTQPTITTKYNSKVVKSGSDLPNQASEGSKTEHTSTSASGGAVTNYTGNTGYSSDIKTSGGAVLPTGGVTAPSGHDHTISSQSLFQPSRVINFIICTGKID